MQVVLYKKSGTYFSKQDNKDKPFTRFYLRCGNSLIPVEPTYFNKKDEKGEDIRDLGYSARKSVLEAFADELPDKEKSSQAKNSARDDQTVEVSESDMPF